MASEGVIGVCAVWENAPLVCDDGTHSRVSRRDPLWGGPGSLDTSEFPRVL